MKTFETEKHNIPEGATHYLEATDSLNFAWWNSRENTLLCPENSGEWQPALISDAVYNPTPIPQTNIETPEEKEALDSINSKPVKPREITQPMLSKCETVFSFSHGERRFILRGVDTDHPQLEVVRHETEAERVEREELEAAYDLYCDHDSDCGFKDALPFDRFVNSLHRIAWINLVRKTKCLKGVRL